MSFRQEEPMLFYILCFCVIAFAAACVEIYLKNSTVKDCINAGNPPAECEKLK